MGEIIRGYELSEDWNQANEGKWTNASKGDKEYFIKQYNMVAVEPDRSKVGTLLSERSYEKMLEKFNIFKKRRERINNKVRTIAGSGGNIVIPLESFVHEHCYTEVSNFYRDKLTEDEIVALPASEKELLMRTLTDTLGAVHRLGIVHSDVKMTNVICTKNSLNKYVLKLIDFGASYFLDDKPEQSDEYSGDPGYASPELGIVWMCKEEGIEPAEYIDKLTVKSDIFSLGILFHRFLTGEGPIYKNIDLKKVFPDRDKSVICPFQILLEEGTLEISPKIKDPRYKKIIPQMLDIDPDKRPTAEEVHACITAALPKDEAEKPKEKTKTEPPLPKKTETKASSVKKTASADPLPTFTPPKKLELKIDEPWQSDNIIWIDGIAELMNRKKLISIERTRNFIGQNAYTVTASGGTKTLLSKDGMIANGYAVNFIISETEYGDTDDILRREDSETYTVNTPLLKDAKLKMKPAERVNAALGKTVLGYELLNTVSKTRTFTTNSNLTLMKYLLKK